MQMILKTAIMMAIIFMVTLSDRALAIEKNDWVRFLEQASFGPTPDLIDT